MKTDDIRHEESGNPNFRGFSVFLDLLGNADFSTAEACILSYVIGFYPRECIVTNEGLGDILHIHGDNVSKYISKLVKKTYLAEPEYTYKRIKLPTHILNTTRRKLSLGCDGVYELAAKYVEYRKSPKQMENDFYFVISKAILDIPDLRLSHKLILAYIVHLCQRNYMANGRTATFNYCHFNNADLSCIFDLTPAHIGIVVDNLIEEGYLKLTAIRGRSHTKLLRANKRYFYDFG